MAEKKELERQLEKQKDKLERGKSVAEKMMDDVLKNMREMQNDFEKKISSYTDLPQKPSMDIIETEEKILVKTDLPGVKKEDIGIELTEDKLSVSATLKEELEIKEADYVKKERKYGKARREILLPAEVKVEEATAKFDNGVLSIELPKVEVKPKFNVEIK